MKKFDVEITETLQRTVSVEAASQEEAERMVTEAWAGHLHQPCQYPVYQPDGHQQQLLGRG